MSAILVFFFANTDIGVHVDDMLAVSPSELRKNFVVGELKGSNTLSFEKPDDNDTILDESGQRRL